MADAQHGPDDDDHDYMFIIVETPRAGDSQSITSILDASTGEPFAGKQLLPNDATPLREAAEKWWNLNHPRILQFKGIRRFEIDVVITEFCGLGNIATLAENEHLAHKDIAKLIKQVSEALEYLHNKGIVHGNLKPSNILVRSRQPLSVAIGDVGTPGNNKWLTQPHYLAPEITLSPGQPQGQNAPADVWALGVIALELLEGRMPDMKDARRYPLFIYKHVEKWPRCSQEALGVLIRDMLNPNVVHRCTATECRQEAEAVLQSLEAEETDGEEEEAEEKEEGEEEEEGEKEEEEEEEEEAEEAEEEEEGEEEEKEDDDEVVRGGEVNKSKKGDKGKEVDRGPRAGNNSEAESAITDGVRGGSGGSAPGPSKSKPTRRSKRTLGASPNQSRAANPKRRSR